MHPAMPLLAAASLALAVPDHTALAHARQPAANTPQAAPASDVAWLKAHAVPLAGVAAGSGFDDLKPLRDMIGDARIVALGESTHGTREHFQLKHRLLEFLAGEMGFTIFSIEASAPESFAVDAYVSRGEGDPKALVGGMLFWTWNTEEVLDMVRWMRTFNEQRPASPGHSIRFTGFDMQSPGLPLKILDEALLADPELGPALRNLRPAARDVGKGPMGGATTAFGVATGSFPPDQAAGKKIRFSGWIRTENLEDGFAGLWWRADKANGDVGAFDNMGGRGPRGTTDWQHFSIDLDIPADTSNINFGVIMPGKGRAWFDDLTIDVDGKPWTAPNADLSFDGDAISGLMPGMSTTYRAVLDRDIKHGGAASLRLEYVAPGPDAPKITAAQGLEQARAFSAALAGARPRLTSAGMPDKTFEWLAFNARLVEQFMLMYADPNGYAVRDLSMAENVRWILDQNPQAKVVLWAHNMHVSTIAPNMGTHLREWYKDQYVSVGFATARGQYTAIKQGKGLTSDNPLQPPPSTSIEAVFDTAGLEFAALDLRPARAGGPAAGDPGSAFLRSPRSFRSIGAGAMDLQFFPVTLANTFDLLMWVRQTTPARQLAGKRPQGIEP